MCFPRNRKLLRVLSTRANEISWKIIKQNTEYVDYVIKKFSNKAAFESFIFLSYLIVWYIYVRQDYFILLLYNKILIFLLKGIEIRKLFFFDEHKTYIV